MIQILQPTENLKSTISGGERWKSSVTFTVDSTSLCMKAQNSEDGKMASFWNFESSLLNEKKKIDQQKSYWTNWTNVY